MTRKSESERKIGFQGEISKSLFAKGSYRKEVIVQKTKTKRRNRKKAGDELQS